MSFNSLGLWSPNRYEIDLSYEVLNIDFGQGAAKISEVKVRGQKKISVDSADPGRISSNRAESADIFFDVHITHLRVRKFLKC